MSENEALPKSGTAEQSTSTSSSVEQSETHNIFDKYKDLVMYGNFTVKIDDKFNLYSGLCFS